MEGRLLGCVSKGSSVTELTALHVVNSEDAGFQNTGNYLIRK